MVMKEILADQLPHGVPGVLMVDSISQTERGSVAASDNCRYQSQNNPEAGQSIAIEAVASFVFLALSRFTITLCQIPTQTLRRTVHLRRL